MNDKENHSIIRWHTHGLSFKVFDKESFEKISLPKYFMKHSKYWSFTRKLGRWGFTRVTSGIEAGSYHHPLFKRDEPNLVRNMICQSASNGTSSAITTKRDSGLKVNESNTPSPDRKPSPINNYNARSNILDDCSEKSYPQSISVLDKGEREKSSLDTISVATDLHSSSSNASKVSYNEAQLLSFGSQALPFSTPNNGNLQKYPAQNVFNSSLVNSEAYRSEILLLHQTKLLEEKNTRLRNELLMQQQNQEKEAMIRLLLENPNQSLRSLNQLQQQQPNTYALGREETRNYSDLLRQIQANQAFAPSYPSTSILSDTLTRSDSMTAALLLASNDLDRQLSISPHILQQVIDQRIQPQQQQQINDRFPNQTNKERLQANLAAQILLLQQLQERRNR